MVSHLNQQQLSKPLCRDVFLKVLKDLNWDCPLWLQISFFLLTCQIIWEHSISWSSDRTEWRIAPSNEPDEREHQGVGWGGVLERDLVLPSKWGSKDRLLWPCAGEIIFSGKGVRMCLHSHTLCDCTVRFSVDLLSPPLWKRSFYENKHESIKRLGRIHSST